MKTKIKKTAPFVSWTDVVFERLEIPKSWLNSKPLTKEEQRAERINRAKYKKWERVQRLKERRRRAKKITMTVGKFEDLLEEVREKVREEYCD